MPNLAVSMGLLPFSMRLLIVSSVFCAFAIGCSTSDDVDVDANIRHDLHVDTQLAKDTQASDAKGAKDAPNQDLAEVDLALDASARDTSKADASSVLVGFTRKDLSLPGGESIPVEFRYPASSASKDAPVAPGQFPLVVFGHGYQQSFGDYEYLARALAEAGYVVALADKRGGDLTIPIDAYAKELRELIAAIHADCSKSSSILYQHLTFATALMGHSTGGGASFIAASLSSTSPAPTTIVALAALGTTYATIHGTNPHQIANKVKIPVLIIDGQKDCICPPAQHTQLIYNNLAGIKYLARFKEGDHCGFSGVNGPGCIKCEAGETLSCGLALQGKTIAPALQNTLTKALVLPWLDHQLKKDPNGSTLFKARLADPRLEVQSSTQ